MKEYINGKVWNTDNSLLLKYVVDIEELGEGYIRYSVRSVMQRPREKDYFVYVSKVTTDKRGGIFDRSEYIVPVDEEYVKGFRRSSPEVWPE